MRTFITNLVTALLTFFRWLAARPARAAAKVKAALPKPRELTAAQKAARKRRKELQQLLGREDRGTKHYGSKRAVSNHRKIVNGARRNGSHGKRSGRQ